jgi:uncharacterized OB-fold protein
MSDENHAMEAARYADGSITYLPHPLGPNGGEPVDTVDLSEHTATVVTWTTSTAPPPGVAEPNHLAIVEFEVSETPEGSRNVGESESVRALGQLTTDDIDIGDEVRPVYTAELRDPEAGIREAESQEWDGYRFEPTE